MILRQQHKKNRYQLFFEKILDGRKPIFMDRTYHEWEFLPDARYSSHEDKRQHYMGNFLTEKKPTIFLTVILFLFVLLMARFWYLQMYRGSIYRQIAEGNRTKLIITKAQRGLMFDRNGALLVQNVPGFMVALQPTQLPTRENELDTYVNRLSHLLNIPRAEIESQIAQNKTSVLPIVIVENIEHEKAILLEVQKDRFPGLLLEAVSYRKYFPSDNTQYPKSLSHLMGYTGLISQNEYDTRQDGNYSFTDYLGKAGLEKFYENELKGTNGVQQIEVDALGRNQKVYKNTPPIPGHDLYLTLDIELQIRVEEIVIEELKKQQKQRAAVVVLDPKNGEILALVSTPFYNSNEFSPKIHPFDYQELVDDPNKPLFNRAISGVYPSGSIIKPVIGWSALDAGIITSNTHILSTGGIRIGQWFFPDWRAGGHGSVDIYDAMAYSVNTFFYYMGGGYEDFQGLGIERMVHTAARFGLGQPLGVDLPGEEGGLLPNPDWKRETKNEPWYIGDTYHFAIGQGDLLVTPLQVATFTAVFANFGTLYQPHLRQQDNPMVREKILSEDIATIRDSMREVVKRGSGRQLNTLSVTSAGKTGTAQWHSQRSTHAWFTSFAPYENPELVITVLVEEGGGGEVSALPIAYKIYQWYFDTYKKSI